MISAQSVTGRIASAEKALIVREPYLNLKIALNDYIQFYETILPFREHVLIAKFEDVTSDFGNVIKNLNNKFSTEFLEFHHNCENVDNVFKDLDSLEPADRKDFIDESRVARPSTDRANNTLKLSIALNSKQYKSKLEKAFELYNALIIDIN